MTNEIDVNQNLANVINGTFTASQQSADIDNPYWCGCYVFLNITAASGTGGLTVSLMVKDPGSGNYDAFTNIGSQKTAAGLYGYIFYPSNSLASDNGGAANIALPRTFAIKIVANDSTSYTYSVSISLIK